MSRPAWASRAAWTAHVERTDEFRLSPPGGETKAPVAAAQPAPGTGSAPARLQFALRCVPPKVSHHRKKIIRLKTKGGKPFLKLGDKPELEAAKDLLEQLLLPHQPPAPIPGPVRLMVTWTWPWLKGHGRRVREGGELRHTSKPDLSNVLKTLEDRLVALRFLEDDRSVVEVRMAKFWGAHPGIVVDIEAVPR